MSLRLQTRSAPRSLPKLWSISDYCFLFGYLPFKSMSLKKSWNFVTAVTFTSDGEHRMRTLQACILISMSTHCTNDCGRLMKQMNGGVTMAKDNRDILKVLK